MVLVRQEVVQPIEVALRTTDAFDVEAESVQSISSLGDVGRCAAVARADAIDHCFGRIERQLGLGSPQFVGVFAVFGFGCFEAPLLLLEAQQGSALEKIGHARVALAGDAQVARCSQSSCRQSFQVGELRVGIIESCLAHHVEDTRQALGQRLAGQFDAVTTRPHRDRVAGEVS